MVWAQLWHEQTPVCTMCGDEGSRIRTVTASTVSMSCSSWGFPSMPPHPLYVSLAVYVLPAPSERPRFFFPHISLSRCCCAQDQVYGGSSMSIRGASPCQAGLPFRVRRCLWCAPPTLGSNRALLGGLLSVPVGARSSAVLQPPGEGCAAGPGLAGLLASPEPVFGAVVPSAGICVFTHVWSLVHEHLELLAFRAVQVGFPCMYCSCPWAAGVWPAAVACVSLHDGDQLPLLAIRLVLCCVQDLSPMYASAVLGSSSVAGAILGWSLPVLGAF